MSYPEFSDFPPIPQRSAAEADFDTKMSALFQHFATTHRAELIALIDFLKTNSTIIGGALNATTVGLDTPAEGKFTAMEADSLGGAAVQADPLDGAAGKLMPVGAFGLGVLDGSLPPDVVDMDTAPSGFGRISGATTGVKPPGVVSGAVLTLINQDGRSSQLVFKAASNRVYVRTKHDGVWRPWSEVYCSENVLGTVSQSGGVPTGALFEIGSNGNGRYLRIADGTQVCWQTQSHDGNNWTNASGNLFTATNSSVWTFPATFSEPPVCHPVAARDELIAIGVSAREVTNTSFSYTPWSSVSLPAGNAKKIMTSANGRWF